MGRIESAIKKRGSQREGLGSGTVPRESSSTDLRPVELRPSPLEQIPRTRVPSDYLAEQRILFTDTDPPIRSAYRFLRTRVIHRMRQNGWHSLAVTSCRPGDGKTLTAINLAISLAEGLSERIILVDFDLRHPSIHRYLGITPKRSVNDYMRGTGSAKEVLLRPLSDRLFIAPTVDPFSDSSEVLASSRTLSFVQELRELDPDALIIYDMPPFLSADDMLAFSPNVDAVLLVVSQGQTPRVELEDAREFLGDTPVLGVVLNRSDEHNRAYY